ncbi:MAG: hypothetical protein A2X58_00405 [Nitrospirae bacterium GWC2_56_14]|nr:MAG: hypothetical protein A2X58_00405 [Nitrospirae bacterium GWC2_56_14]
MAGRTTERLPGIRFETETKQKDETLRMDIAVFVGFAAKGDLHKPTPVEDIHRFEEIFGGDLTLAREAETGRKVCAYLAPCVRLFFNNGGRRCWIIRVPHADGDGLVPFNAALFLDPELSDCGTDMVMAQADFLRYCSPSPRTLSGIHAALAVEEASIISVPDAIHLGWDRLPDVPQPKAPEANTTSVQAGQQVETCIGNDKRKEKGDKTNQAERTDLLQFFDCDRIPPPRPELSSTKPDDAGNFILRWTDVPDAVYVLEETVTEWSAATESYKGKEQSLLYNRPPNDYFYRVRAIVGCAESDWSDGVAVRVGPPVEWRQNEAAAYQNDALRTIHQALVRMCAARGDLFAVLTMPGHYRENEARVYADDLQKTAPAIGKFSGPTAQLEMSCAALYHPWLITHAEGDARVLRSVPPDGAVAGIMAKRAVERGAWIAPANENLQGCVALTPAISEELRLTLQEARINLIRQEPRGFLVLDADTLSSDRDLRPIGVRRLLMLLRRAALRLGGRYVFEPNDAALRRSVRRGFEALLADLHKRGALKGTTPAEAYQVVTDESVNTATSTDQGRFIAELRVAPSLPLTFLTVRMIQTGEHISLVEGAQ